MAQLVGQPVVEQDDVRVPGPHGLQPGGGRLDRGGDRYVISLVERSAKRLREHAMVLDDQDPDLAIGGLRVHH